MAGLTVVAAAPRAGAVARFAPAKKVRERYVRPELGTPAWLLAGRRVLVVPLATALDEYADVYEAALETMASREAPFALVVLASVVERLVHLGFRNTLERTRGLLERFGGVCDRAHYLANTFMVSEEAKVLDTALDALQWMRFVLDARNPDAALVVVTENPDFARLARAKHLQVMTTCELVARQGMDDLVEIAHSIRAARHGADVEHGPESGSEIDPWNDAFWPAHEVDRRVASNEAIRGKFRRNKLYPDEVTIVRPGSLPDVTFKARAVNRAVHDDEVVVQGQRVVAVERRNWRPYVVALARGDAEKARAAAAGASLSVLCVPLDARVPKIRISTRQADALADQRFVVALDDWAQGQKYPRGHFVRTLGPIGYVPAESTAIIVETGLAAHLQPFTPKALACLPPDQHRWAPPREEVEARRDLRDALIFSVDPPSCQDIDDTMSFEVLADGAVRLGVHIADVTHFLSHGSALDVEAQKRATSVYLKDRRLDMLPRLLCEDLCSLRAGVDRLAVSVVWTLDAPNEDDDGLAVRSVWTGRTVIRSAQALSYAQAQRLVDGEDPLHETDPAYASSHTGKPVAPDLVDPLRAALRGLQSVARLRTRQRQRNGALELQGEEFQFGLDDAQRPDRIMAKRKLEVHDVVAEMMILANEQVAREIVQTSPRAAFIRRHAKPPDKKLGAVLKLAREAGISLDTSSNASLAASMARARAVVSADVFAVLNDGLTRAMSEAEYTCAGEVADISHFGLGLDFYTHFTSPIRRYADVIVHRQLLAAPDSLGNAEPRGDDGKAETPSAPIAKPVDAAAPWLAAADRASRDAELLYGDLQEPAQASQGCDDLLDGLLDGLEDNGDASNLDLDLHDLLDSGGQAAAAAGPDVAPGAATEVNADDIVLDSLLAGGSSTARRSLDGATDKVTKEDAVELSLQHQAEHINALHRAAKEASFRSEELFFSLYFQRNPQVSMAVAVSIHEYGVLCYLPQFHSKLLLRFDGPTTLHVGRSPASEGGSEDKSVAVRLVSQVTFNFEDHHSGGGLGKSTTGAAQSYARVNISSVNVSALEPTSLEVLRPLTVYICCDAPQDNPASRIPKPKLVLYAPRSPQERDRIISHAPGHSGSGTRAVKAFAREASPSHHGQRHVRGGSDRDHDSSTLQLDPAPSSRRNAGSSKRDKGPATRPHSLYGALQDAIQLPPKPSTMGRGGPAAAEAAQVRKGKGRICFGGFQSPELVARKARASAHDALGAAVSDEVHHHGAPASFTRIQHDHRAVDNYVRDVTRDVTRRIEGLAKAKRETKIKKRLKQG